MAFIVGVPSKSPKRTSDDNGARVKRRISSNQMRLETGKAFEMNQ